MKLHEWLFHLVLDTLACLWIIAFIFVLLADFQVPVGMHLWEFIVYDRVGVIHEMAYMWAAMFASMYTLIWLRREWGR